MSYKRSYKLLSKGLTFCLLFTIISSSATAQKDTTEIPDSLRFYKKIKHFAYKYKITSLAFDAMFVDPEVKEYPTQPTSKQTKNVNPYQKYQGRVIKEIRVTVYDPFGHSVTDTIQHSVNTIQRLGNKAHITTRKFVVINKLLFKKDEKVNALSISESERTLRTAVFVNDAKITIIPSSHKDSVIVSVVVHDKWPITVPFMITDVFIDSKFTNNNLFGVGQQFGQYGRVKKSGDVELSGYYGVANIDNTYISGELGYAYYKDNTLLRIGFDRPFFSPLTEWAGGASASHAWKKSMSTDTVTGVVQQSPLNSFGYDLWVGKSIKLKKLSKDRSIFNQSTNVIFGTRFFQNRYLTRPSDPLEVSKYHYNTTAALGNICFSVQQYYKDHYIYRFGANEDVPEGLIVQFIYGGLKQEFKKIRYYTGFEVARAKHFDFGYLSSTISYGILFNEKVSNDITLNYKLTYFSNLLKNGSWLFREFLHFNFVHGENKIAGETVTFSGDELYGFENGSLAGNTKMTLNSETVAYLPYNLIGFMFAPVINVGLGIIGTPTSELKQSNLYQAYTIGVMVRNENLLSSTFQFSLGAYPFFPDGGKFTLKYNPVATFTLKVRAFAVTRPDFVSY